MANRPKLQKPLLMKPTPKAARYELPAEFASQIEGAIAGASRLVEEARQRLLQQAEAELQKVRARAQEQVDAVSTALCSIEAKRLGLDIRSLKLSTDNKALELKETER